MNKISKQAAALGRKAGHQHAGTPVSLLYPPFFSPSHAKEPFFLYGYHVIGEFPSDALPSIFLSAPARAAGQS
ncbi:hypothetical protein FJTKL_11273 [Diaporthe vaccinii]|uniref:Uncharacterized protein n=1 Tax=Diaporthe vaccinii TaxID=105482 RepID=A0ABR4EHF2_9PEZI